jgi:hypothetical protein
LCDLLQLPPLHLWQLVLPQLMAALRGTSPAARRLTMVPLRVLAAAAPAAVVYPLAAEMAAAAAAAQPTHPADACNSARNEAQVRLQIAVSTVLKLQVQRDSPMLPTLLCRLIPSPSGIRFFCR